MYEPKEGCGYDTQEAPTAADIQRKAVRYAEERRKAKKRTRAAQKAFRSWLRTEQAKLHVTPLMDPDQVFLKMSWEAEPCAFCGIRCE